MSEMVFAQGDDWMGIYIDGVLQMEGHSISPLEAVQFAVGYGVRHAKSLEVDLDWLHDRGDLPAEFDDVQWAAPTGVGTAA